MVRVDVETADTVLDDLEGTAEAGREGRQAADHGLDHRQPERLEERGLDKGAPAVGDKPVELAAHDPVMVAHPSHLAVEIVLVHQLVHAVDLGLLLGVM